MFQLPKIKIKIHSIYVHRNHNSNILVKIDNVLFQSFFSVKGPCQLLKAMTRRKKLYYWLLWNWNLLRVRDLQMILFVDAEPWKFLLQSLLQNETDKKKNKFPFHILVHSCDIPAIFRVGDIENDRIGDRSAFSNQIRSQRKVSTWRPIEKC